MVFYCLNYVYWGIGDKGDYGWLGRKMGYFRGYFNMVFIRNM